MAQDTTQDTTDEQAEPETSETEEAQPSTEEGAEAVEAPEGLASDLSVGPDGQILRPGELPPQEALITDVFDDWELRCTESRSGCFMYQLARDESLNPVSEISIVNLPDGGEAAAGVTIVTPLGTLLSEGIVLQVDSARARQYPYNWCTPAGCFARFGFTPADVDALKRGSTARMRIVSVSAPERPLVLDISLKGFTAAYNEMTK